MNNKPQHQTSFVWEADAEWGIALGYISKWSVTWKNDIMTYLILLSSQLHCLPEAQIRSGKPVETDFVFKLTPMQSQHQSFQIKHQAMQSLHTPLLYHTIATTKSYSTLSADSPSVPSFAWKWVCNHIFFSSPADTRLSGREHACPSSEQSGGR